MWISRRRWQELSNRVTDVESSLRYKTHIFVPKESLIDENSFLVKGFLNKHDPTDIGTHKGLTVAELVVALVDHCGLRWYSGEPGKLVSGKKAK